MKNLAKSICVIVAVVQVHTCLANTDLVVLNAADFPLGTDVNDALPGATLTAIGTSVPTPRVLVERRFGKNVLAHDGDRATLWSDLPFEAFDARLRVDFAVPTDLISVTFLADDLGIPMLPELYSNTGVRLTAFHSVGVSQKAFSIASVGYRRIPEPTSGSLLLVGLVVWQFISRQPRLRFASAFAP